MIAHVDGHWVDGADATLPISDRGFVFGDAVFDTCRVFEGALFRFEEHARRLRASGAVLRIDVPASGELRAIAEGLLARNPETEHGVLRITVTRGSGGAGLASAGAGPVRVIGTLRPLPSDWRVRAGEGWSVMTAMTRHLPPEAMPPALKAPGRVSSLLARLEAEAAGCDDALLLSIEGRITEGTTWNVFWRRGRVLRTPAEDQGILAGVTRALVLELAAEGGFDLEQGSWPRGELDDADEAFATMTSLGMVPIHTLDGRAFPGTGEAVNRLSPRYWDRVREEAGG